MTGRAAAPPGLYVGVDLGGTATRFVATDAHAQVVRSQIVSTPSGADSTDLEVFLTGAIVSLSEGMSLTAIGVGASGPISRDGIIRNPDTLPAFTGVDVPAMLNRVFGVPSFIANDAVTAALGEALRGAGRGFEDILMITLGTGIGVCMLQRGEPVRGADGLHPETGHMSIGGSIARCYCGRDTCWEQAASRSALQRACAALVVNPTNSSQDIDTMAQLASAGDQPAISVFDDFGLRLAHGVATLLAVYRPEVLIIGGSGSAYFTHFRVALHRTLGGLTGTFPPSTISVAHFGEHGGAIGAAALAIAEIARGRPGV
ncbi:MAG: hypothetical protein RI885_2671 [Actinomycetota bacterium]|jgi:glucokinase